MADMWSEAHRKKDPDRAWDGILTKSYFSTKSAAKEGRGKSRREPAGRARKTYELEFWKECGCTKACCVSGSGVPTCQHTPEHFSLGPGIPNYLSRKLRSIFPVSGWAWVKHHMQPTDLTLQGAKYYKEWGSSSSTGKMPEAYIYRNGLKWRVKAVMLWMYII